MVTFFQKMCKFSRKRGGRISSLSFSLSLSLSPHFIPITQFTNRQLHHLFPFSCSLSLSLTICTFFFVLYEEEEAAKAAGLLTTKITESPLKNILLTYRSLLIAIPLELLRAFPPLEYSVHISFTSSSSLFVVVIYYYERVFMCVFVCVF